MRVTTPTLRHLDHLRNIGIAAHVDAGKTTLTERILYFTGRIRRVGEVHDGASTTDHLPEERARGITITAAATSAPWERLGQPYTLNIIDTPGHVDFTIEVERSMRVLDGALAVLDASQGVEPQTETVWRQADRYGVPRLVLVNKLDKTGADFDACLSDLRTILGVCPLPIQRPIYNTGGDLLGVLDVVDGHWWPWTDPGPPPQPQPLPTDLQAQAQAARHTLWEALAELDETLLDGFLSGQQPDAATLRAALRRATLRRAGFPVLCGSALKNQGVVPLLDAVVDYLPAPSDLPDLNAQLHGEPVTLAPVVDGTPVALAFKTVADAYGTLTFVRVYSGTLHAGSTLSNTRTGERERASALVRVHADQTEDTPTLHAGDIGAIRGLKRTRTGDTLTAPDAPPLALESLTVPDPVLACTVTTPRPEDQARLLTALSRATAEDPTLHLGSDPETGLPLLSGMGELHLEVVLDRLRRETGLATQAGQPGVAYRETITRTARTLHTLKKQTGGSGQFAAVELEVRPLPQGSGHQLQNAVVGGSIPTAYVGACLASLRDGLSSGPLGYPVQDVAVTLLGGKAHATDSSELAFRTAAQAALREALQAAQPVRLHPMMRVDVTTPDSFTGTVIGDLNRRRGQVQTLIPQGNAQTIRALVPLAALFGYATDLRSATQGRASFSLSFDHYAPEPPR